MKTSTKSMALLLIVALSMSSMAWTQESTDSDTESKDKPETVQALKVAIQFFESIDAVIQSANTREVEARMKVWTKLIVDDIVPDGKPVKKGDLLVRFETDEIDQQLESARLDFEMAKKEFQTKQLAAEQAQTKFDLESAANEREMQNARQDYEYYQSVTRPQQLDDFEYQLKSSEYSLEYAREELEQLLQMYNEDELTEDSERIVLKRAERRVESAERSLKRTRIRVKRSKEIELPRQDLSQADQLRRKVLEYEQKKIALEIERDRAQNALAQAELELKKSELQLKRLAGDREQMELRASMDGRVIYGRCDRGKWLAPPGATNRRYEPGDKIPAGKVFMTIIDPNDLVLRCDLAESQLADFREGLTGTAVLNANQQVTFPAEFKTFDSLPMANGKFDGLWLIRAPKPIEHLAPARTCKIACQVYSNEEAVMLPKASVFSDDGVHYYVFRPDGNRQTVAVGREKDNFIEIRDGVDEGDEVLKARPKS